MKKEETKKAEEKELEQLKAKCEEYLEGWKRERANFLNYKKEEMERIGELIKYANEELILRILPVLDNFLIAEKNISEEMKKNETIAGLLQIHQQLKDFLKLQGLEETKAVGEKFDPNFHEAVEGVSKDLAPEKSESGTIIEETQKGYTLYGRVVRPAKVKVKK